MQLPRPDTTHDNATLIDRIEQVLIVAMAILLPFDHWFFGHIVNPAPMRVLGFVLTGVWIVQIALRKIPFRFHLWHATAAIFVAVCFYSALYSPIIPNPDIDNYSYKLAASAKIASALLFLAVACAALNTGKILLFLRVHIIWGSIICIVSLLLYIAHMSKFYSHGFALWIDKDIYNFVRIQGVSFEPHRFGAYTLTLIPWLLISRTREQLGIGFQSAMAALAIIFICLMLSYSVATYVALPLLLLILAIHSRDNFSMLLRIMLVATILLAVAMQIPAVSQGTVEIIDVKMRGESVNDRIYQWGLAAMETALYPWTGVGPEGYSHFLSTIDPRLVNVTPASNPPQSMLYGIMANTGLPGIGSFLVFMLAFLASYVYRYKKASNDKTLSHVAIAVAISHFVYQQSIWLPWSLNQWLFMAIAWATLHIGKSGSKQTS